MNIVSAAFVMMWVSTVSWSAECPNFAGKYDSKAEPNDSTRIELTIEQTGCDKLAARYRAQDGKVFNRPMVVDGKMHTTFDSSAFTMTEAFTWKDGVLAYVQDMLMHNDNSVIHAKGTIALTGDQLVEDTAYLDSNGQPAYHETATFIRKHE